MSWNNFFRTNAPNYLFHICVYVFVLMEKAHVKQNNKSKLILCSLKLIQYSLLFSHFFFIWTIKIKYFPWSEMRNWLFFVSLLLRHKYVQCMYNVCVYISRFTRSVHFSTDTFTIFFESAWFSLFTYFYTPITMLSNNYSMCDASECATTVCEREQLAWGAFAIENAQVYVLLSYTLLMVACIVIRYPLYHTSSRSYGWQFHVWRT